MYFWNKTVIYVQQVIGTVMLKVTIQAFIFSKLDHISQHDQLGLNT
jgi:hypothetical protein